MSTEETARKPPTTPLHNKAHNKRSIEEINTQISSREKNRTKIENNSNNNNNTDKRERILANSNQSLSKTSNIPKTNIDLCSAAAISATHYTNNNTMIAEKIRQLRLEAIFHPKFDNENQKNQEIREQMKDKVSLEKGYLEVSLKHSGSLLLWSGGQRYYSKNSTDNYFSNAGEISLRQHFYRAWHNDNDENCHTGQTQLDLFEKAYRDCSDFVERNRLTLAFELVTSFLGHHGSLPHRDFLVLTAVADKKSGRFYSTAELVTLAQKFRLPHNDSWSFTSVASVNALFELYETTRETGLADDTCTSLTSLAEGHVCSMYPHSTFQGNILEGIVIRYIPYRESSKEEQDKLLQLETKSKEILKDIPPEKADCFALMTQNNNNNNAKATPPPPYLLTVNLRQIFRESFKSGAQIQEAFLEFESRIQDILEKSDGNKRRSRKTLSNSNVTKSKEAQHPVQGATYQSNTEQTQVAVEINIPNLAKELLERETDLDIETKRIAKTICNLEDIKGKATYKLYKEMGQNGLDTRLLCIIHVIHDNTFKTFQRHMKTGDMALYRGFSVELIPETHPVMEDSIFTEEVFETDRKVDVHDENDGSLMLKMKFLPYMVRTFGCRNGLRILKQSGPVGFERYVLSLFQKWGISPTAIAHWHPLFTAWANYAYANIDNETTIGIEGNPNMLPLNSTYYLDHFENFYDKYQRDPRMFQAQNNSDSFEGFSGTVIVAAPDKARAEEATGLIAKELGDIRQCDDINKIKEQDLIRSRLPSSGGLVCAYTLPEGMKKNIRKILKGFHSSTSVVLIDCDEENVAKLEEAEGRNKVFGMAKGIRKIRFAAVLDLQSKSWSNKQENNDNRSQLSLVLAKLLDVSRTIEKPDMRPGMLIFFPTIPGSGKSSLCDSQLCQDLEDISKRKSKFLSKQNTKPREVVLLEGDKVKGKYWQVVKRERSMKTSSIFIADKNVPPTAWCTVGESCSMSSGWAVPVLPDDKALTTTSISGIRNGDGELISDRNHNYPFSLLFLAVCLARVLARPPNTHAGKLDSATGNACMILIKFFSFYRNISAGEFEDSIKGKLNSVGMGSCLKKAVRVPFFASEKLPDIPSDLKDTLIKALQVQYGCDQGMNRESSGFIKDLETSLRTQLETHKTFLNKLTVSKEESKKTFCSDISHLMEELEELESTNTFHPIKEVVQSSSSAIKIVSVDVGIESVHRVLRTCETESASLSSFLGTIRGNYDSDTGIYTGEGFVTNTHVTMVHCSEMKQVEIHELFDKILGHSVSISIKSFIWSEKVAAFAVEVGRATEDEKKIPIPSSRNVFSHITVWHAKNARAVMANQLPEMIENGEANRFDFTEPRRLRGTISFWDTSKSSV